VEIRKTLTSIAIMGFISMELIRGILFVAEKPNTREYYFLDNLKKTRRIIR
jgi:hypothetical protein